MARTTHKTEIDEGSCSEPKDESRLENDPRFLRRIEQARASMGAGRRVRLEDLETE
ncbi:MAG TPA: hypothetical protein VGO01_03330 [Bradyrhizobium sp.]|jgi:hypothetical protein|nr:hypothetical protein [Bradyrhizobium sp.]